MSKKTNDYLEREKRERGPDTSDKVEIVKGNMQYERGKIILSPGLFCVNDIGFCLDKETSFDSVKDIIKEADSQLREENDMSI